MTGEEAKLVLKDLKSAFKRHFKDKTDEEIDEMILDSFFQAYCEDKMCREDLTALTDIMGYEVKDEILDQIEEEKRREREG